MQSVAFASAVHSAPYSGSDLKEIRGSDLGSSGKNFTQRISCVAASACSTYLCHQAASFFGNKSPFGRGHSSGAAPVESPSNHLEVVSRYHAVGVSSEDRKVYPSGDFCPLYSDLKSFSPQSKCFSAMPKTACSLPNGGRWKAVNTSHSVEDLLGERDLSLPIHQGFGRSADVRSGHVSRLTKETQVDVQLVLEGTGISDCNTGIPFLDHMLDQLAVHGLFDVSVLAKGDLHIDDHHTNEDVGLAVGSALLEALGNRKGIHRFGDFSAPLDEALVHVVLDLSGRPYLGYDLQIPTQQIGTYDTQLVEHFFQSLVNNSGMTLHIRQLAGKNSHHIVEATFKAFARALRQATEFDSRRTGSIPSSKGVLSRQ